VRIYLLSLGAGLLVGLVYGLLGVRSPAPPLVALLGLLGILVGEQLAALGRRVARAEPVTAAWFSNECAPQVTGVPPAPPREPEDRGTVR
jgi:XapX domain-containing protein